MSMSKFRKIYEIKGYAPADAGALLCVQCHGKVFPGHNPLSCDCGPVFLSTETDTSQCCDSCFEEIETSVLDTGSNC